MKVLIISLLSVFLLIWIIWRFASRRTSLPCPTWLGWLVERDNPFTKTNRAETIIQHLALQQGMQVLDVGCGPGRLTIPVATQVGPSGEVVAMDIQIGMIHRTQKKVKIANLSNVKFIHADVGEKDLEQERFDRVLLVTVLGEIPSRESALQAIFSALKLGGILSITEIIFDPHFQRRRTVLRLAGAVGFREQKFFGNSIAYTLHLEKPL